MADDYYESSVEKELNKNVNNVKMKTTECNPTKDCSAALIQ